MATNESTVEIDPDKDYLRLPARIRGEYGVPQAGTAACQRTGRFLQVVLPTRNTRALRVRIPMETWLMTRRFDRSIYRGGVNIVRFKDDILVPEDESTVTASLQTVDADLGERRRRGL